MKRLFIVAYFFPPTAASGSFRPLGFCRYLDQYGWRPTVITTNSESIYPSLPQDEKLVSLIPDHVKIERISHPVPSRSIINIRESVRGNMRRMFGERVRTSSGLTTLSSEHVKSGNPSRWWTSAKDDLWNWLFLFPDAQRFWLRAVIRHMPKLASRESPDAIWATGSPWTSLLVGKKLAEYFHVPFFADFRDPWQGNPYFQQLSPRQSSKARMLEHSICATASNVIATTAELTTRFKMEYEKLQGKFVTITNGFDGESLDPATQEFGGSVKSVSASEQAIEISHFGSIYGERNPFPFLRAIRELLEERKIRPQSIRVSFFGSWDIEGDEERLAEDLESKGILSRRLTIPHDECLAEMADANVLLVIQPNSPLQIPGKIYEYASLAKPILVIGDTGATATLVNENQLGLCCPNEISALKDILVNMLVHQNIIAPPPQAVIEKFHYRSLTGQLASVLNSVS